MIDRFCWELFKICHKIAQIGQVGYRGFKHFSLLRFPPEIVCEGSRADLKVVQCSASEPSLTGYYFKQSLL